MRYVVLDWAHIVAATGMACSQDADIHYCQRHGSSLYTSDSFALSFMGSPKHLRCWPHLSNFELVSQRDGRFGRSRFFRLMPCTFALVDLLHLSSAVVEMFKLGRHDMSPGSNLEGHLHEKAPEPRTVSCRDGDANW